MPHPPRRNKARRGRKAETLARCASSSVDTYAASEQMESRLQAAVVVVEKLSEPLCVVRKPASNSCAAIEPSAKKSKLDARTAAVEATEPAELEEASDRACGDATDEEAEFEALVLDADDDEGASAGTAEDQKADDNQKDSGGEEEDDTNAEAEKLDPEGDESADAGDAETAGEAEGFDMDADDAEQEGHDESAENVNGEEYAEVDEEDPDEAGEELQDGEEVVEAAEDEEEAEDADEGIEEWDGEANVADEVEEGAEEGVEYEEGEGAEYEEWDGDGDDAQVVDDADDAECPDGGENEDMETAEAEPADGGEGQDDAEYDEEQESKDGAFAEHDEQESKDEAIPSSVGDDAAGGDILEHAAVDDSQNVDADDGNAPETSELCICEGEEGQEGETTVESTANEELQDDGAAGDLLSSEHAFAVMEEGVSEPLVEVAQLTDLCPIIELEQPGSIPVSCRDSIQRSVHRFIERLLRLTREVGAPPEDMRVIGQDGKKAVFGCTLCNVEMEQPEQFDYHVESPQHVKRLRWMYFMGVNKELSQLNCRVCHISMPCREHLSGHLRSDRHVCLSKALNVHPAYSEYLLLQHFSWAEVQSMLQSQQRPAAARSQQAVADKGKHLRGKKPQTRLQESSQGQQKQGLEDAVAEADGSSQITRDGTKGSSSTIKLESRRETHRDEKDKSHSKDHRSSRDRSRGTRRDRSGSRDARRSGHTRSRDGAFRRGSGRSDSRDGSSRRPAGRGMSSDAHRDRSRTTRGNLRGSSKREPSPRSAARSASQGEGKAHDSKAADSTKKEVAPSASKDNQVEDGPKAEGQDESKVGVTEGSGDNVTKEDTKADNGDAAPAADAGGDSKHDETKGESKKSEPEGGDAKDGNKTKGEDSKEEPKGDASDDRSKSRRKRPHSRSRSRSLSRGRARTGPRRGPSPRDSLRDSRRHMHRDSPPRRRPPELHEMSRGSRKSRSSSRERGPRASPPLSSSSFKCYSCNLSFFSTREYSEHFASRSHRLGAGAHGAPSNMRKRSRSPSPLSRPLRRSPHRSPRHSSPWRSPRRSPRRSSPHHHHHHHHHSPRRSPRRSPQRSRSPLRLEHWSGAGHPTKQSPDVFSNHARDLMAQQSAAVFPAGLTASQAGLLEEYTERRGGGAVPPTASTVAATLETMIQLQQRLLSITAAQQQQQQVSAASLAAGMPGSPSVGGGVAAGTTSSYRGDDFASRGLQEMDLQKSLQQLRQSQRYNVSPTVPYAGGSAVGSQQTQHVQAHQVATAYAPSAASGLRDAGASYQSSTMDAYSNKKGLPYVGGPGSYSQTGSQLSSSGYGSSGAYAGSTTLGGGSGSITSAGVRTNEYRKSSLGPTAPIPTNYGRLGHLGRAAGAPGIKRF